MITYQTPGVGNRKRAIWGAPFLAREEIAAFAPAVYAEAPHHSRSTSYGHVNTGELLDLFGEAGYLPTAVAKAIPRIVDRRPHARHMIRLRHAESQPDAEEAFEIILLNSSDGTSSVQVLCGVYRFVCFNGLVAGTGIDEVRAYHRSRAAEVVRKALDRILCRFATVSRVIEDMRNTSLSSLDRGAFAATVAMARFGEGSPIDPSRLLEPRRPEDVGTDLWTTLNVVQENVIRGGLRVPAGLRRPRQRRRTAAIGSVDREIGLNRLIWSEAMRFLPQQETRLLAAA